MDLISFDWNWFFSSFSQCGAAIIGILSGFIISRLLDINNKLNYNIEEFDDLGIQYRDFKKRIRNIDFERYHNNVLRTTGSIWGDLKNGSLKKMSNPERLNYAYRICNADLYKADNQILDIINQILHSTKQFFFEYEDPETNKSKSNDKTSTKSLIQEFKFQAEKSIEKYKYNSLKFSNLLNSYITLRVIISILLISLFCLVIYPLHFLPVSENLHPQISLNITSIIENLIWFRVILLVIFFILIGSIFVYFLINIKKKIKVIKKKKTQFDEYINILNYSSYFEIVGIIPN